MPEVLSLLLGFGAALASAVAAYFQVRHSKAEAKIKTLESKLESAKSDHKKDLDTVTPFIKTIVYTEYDKSDILIIGPRYAGKTSLVKYWVEFWRAHLSTSPTSHVDLHEFTFPGSYARKSAKTMLNISMDANVYTRLKIWDFGGEPHLINEAINRIGNMQRCTLILVISSEKEHSQRNIEYFSTSFIVKMRELFLSGGAKNLIKTIVIFTKIDLLSPEQRSKNILEKRYDGCLHAIKQVFGPDTSIYALSGQTGEGIVPFLQDVSSVYVDKGGISRFKS